MHAPESTTNRKSAGTKLVAMNADPSESYCATFASETKGGAVVMATSAGEQRGWLGRP